MGVTGSQIRVLGDPMLLGFVVGFAGELGVILVAVGSQRFTRDANEFQPLADAGDGRATVPADPGLPLSFDVAELSGEGFADVPGIEEFAAFHARGTRVPGAGIPASLILGGDGIRDVEFFRCGEHGGRHECHRLTVEKVPILFIRQPAQILLSHP
jgi:hypothetical protein